MLILGGGGGRGRAAPLEEDARATDGRATEGPERVLSFTDATERAETDAADAVDASEAELWLRYRVHIVRYAEGEGSSAWSPPSDLPFTGG